MCREKATNDEAVKQETTEVVPNEYKRRNSAEVLVVGSIISARIATLALLVRPE